MEILQTMVFRHQEQNLRGERAETLIATRLFRLASGSAGDVRPIEEYSPVHQVTRGSSAMDKLVHYDPATALVDNEETVVLTASALEVGDAAYIVKALDVVARAKEMTNIMAETGLSHERLYRSFSEKGNPTLKTTLVVMKVFSIELILKKQPHFYLPLPTS